jgi:hypothetical protein
MPAFCSARAFEQTKPFEITPGIDPDAVCTQPGRDEDRVPGRGSVTGDREVMQCLERSVDARDALLYG